MRNLKKHPAIMATATVDNNLEFAFKIYRIKGNHPFAKFCNK